MISVLLDIGEGRHSATRDGLGVVSLHTSGMRLGACICMFVFGMAGCRDGVVAAMCWAFGDGHLANAFGDMVPKP